MKNKQKKYLWDLYIRLFHFLLIIFIFGSILTAKLNRLDLHQYFGISIIVFLFFRLFWGFYGTYYARFKNFIYSPFEVFDFVKGSKKKYYGHSPLGSYSVFSILLILFLTSISGLFSSDDVIYDGPLTFLMPNYVGTWTYFHNILHYILYFLLILHVIAIFYYQFVKKQKLIQQMIDGYSRKLILTKVLFSKSYIIKGVILMLLSMIIPFIILFNF